MAADHQFHDAAIAPALSADGRMLTFIRGDTTFISRGQIYVKMLPDGPPIQLTHDNLRSLRRIFTRWIAHRLYRHAVTIWEAPVLAGGEPHRTLANAGG